MIVCVHQPSYFPWLGLLHKIKESDLFVFLDTVQFSDSLYQHRNLFVDNQGKETLLTIPVNKKGYAEKKIKDMVISNSIWQKKHKKFIYFNYKNHPYFDEIFSLIEPIYSKKYTLLADLLTDTMEVALNIFGIDTQVLKASDLTINPDLAKEEMVLDILSATDATIYLSGEGARSYQKDKNFEEQNIKLLYQKFIHPNYIQASENKEFIAGLSCLDAAFNVGKTGCCNFFSKTAVQ